MPLVSDILDRARANLTARAREEVNTLAVAYTAGSGTMTFTYPVGGITPGSRISVGLNTLHVWSVDAAGTATVSGGWDGSTDANAAAGAVVRVNPRFTDSELLAAVNDDLADLSAQGLYQMRTVDVTFNPVVEGYDLPGDVLEVYEVRYQTPGPYKDWPRIPKVSWRVERNQSTTDFPSGTALHLFAGGYPGFTVRVLFKSGFTAVSSPTQDLAATTGLPVTAVDLPPLGVALRLGYPWEARRNYPDAQGDTRRAAEVPPGAVLGGLRGLAALRAARIQAEVGRLAARYPDVVV